MSKQALVCWSGGRDSTLLLHNLLSEEDTIVRAISIIHEQVDDERQKEARTKIKEKLVNKFREFTSFEVTISFDEGSPGAYVDNGLIQPVLWIPTASTFLKNEEDLYVGYIRGDDVWHARYQITEIFKNIQYIMGKSGDIKFPLEPMNKADVILELSRTGLLHDTWFCQENGPIPCGKCSSCETDAMHTFILEKRGYTLDDEKGYGVTIHEQT